MRALADVLLAGGWQLSGSDLQPECVQRMADAGVRLHPGHAAEHVPPETELVVYSDAVTVDNPELRRAGELGVEMCSYFEMLGRLAADRQTLAVAGTHGKSTTTAMAAHLLSAAGRDPTVLCGATPLGQSSGGRAGRSDLLLVEACEYRANFLRLRPQQAVILGIEPDHFDYYASTAQLHRAFARFAGSVPKDGLVLVRHDCTAARQTTAALPCRVTTFGTAPAADWSARGLTHWRGRYAFEIRRLGRPMCTVRLQVPGRHNVLNALAAAALAWENGVSSQRIATALGRFRGLHRRMELLGSLQGVLLVDDYAHHPTEVAAALHTVRRMAPGRRLWCVFQPHQASRTERLLDELAKSLHNADKVLITEIFRAREGRRHPGEVTAEDLARQVRSGGVEVAAVHATEDIVRLLQTHLDAGDVLITIGAGNVDRIARRLIGSVSWRRVAS